MPLFEVDQALEAVKEDLTVGFRDIFQSAGDGPTAVGVFADRPIGTEPGTESDTVSVVAWEWDVIHAGSLQGTPRTARQLTMRGVTVIERAEEGLVYWRYIDWLALYAGLGAVTIARPVVDDREGLANVPFPIDDEIS